MKSVIHIEKSLRLIGHLDKKILYNVQALVIEPNI